MLLDKKDRRAALAMGNSSGYTPLYSLASHRPVDRAAAKIIARIAVLMLRAGAVIQDAVKDWELNQSVSVLHRAIHSSNYPLMKILLQLYAERGGDVTAMINKPAEDGCTAVHLAAMQTSPRFLKYLLIHPGVDTLQRNGAGRLPSELCSTDTQRTLLHDYAQRLVPATDGIHWSSTGDVRWGDFVSPGQPAFVDRRQLHDDKFSNSGLPEKDWGNPVYHLFAFIVKEPGKALREVIVKVERPDTHVSGLFSNADGFRDAIAARVDAAPGGMPKHPFMQFLSVQQRPLTAQGVKDLFAHSKKLAKRVFTHGEQTMLSDMENPHYCNLIVEQLVAKVDLRTQVKGVIVTAYSKRYVCGQCALSLAGEQNPAFSPFVRQLKAALEAQNKGVHFPMSGVVPLVFRIGSIWACGNKKQADAHYDYQVDLRAASGVVLQKDMKTMSEGEGGSHSRGAAAAALSGR
jgi:hypothetical protein